MTTDYNEIGAAFVQTKGSPLKQYSERWMVFNALNDVRGKSVLDLACGAGDYAREIKERGAAQVVGVDISETMITLAQEQEERQPLGIAYYVRDVTKLEQLGSFDLAIAVFLLVYAPTEQALADMCRAIYKNLAPGGRCVAVITHPDLAEPHIAAARSTGITMEVDGPLREGAELTITIPTPSGPIQLINYLWSKATYERAMHTAGFREVKWHPVTVAPEGVQALGAEYWREFLAYPSISVVEFLV